MNGKVEDILSEMTLEEKAKICSGKNFWLTNNFNRLSIESILMTDGPHGLRKQSGNIECAYVEGSVPATCFPSASTTACSWDKDLIEKIGEILGDECLEEEISILLGPGVNIKRSPLCGRNFEYFSEDPFLASEAAASFIKGVQSRGIGTSIKHFAANNQEYRRLSVNAVIDQRVLRELYLASFENAIKKSKPWTVMAAYNKLNGVYCANNKELLTEILRDEWGFDGIIISDWGAIDDNVESVIAGLDLEMPGSQGRGMNKIIEAVKEGRLDEKILNETVKRLLKIILKATENKKNNKKIKCDKDSHHKFAKKVAVESMVLLKNENNILPIEKNEEIAIIGEFAREIRYQGGGSSHVNPYKIDVVIDEIKNKNSKTIFAKGYNLESDDVDYELIREAVSVSEKVKKVVLFIGLPDRYESEGYDRKHLSIPQSHIKLLDEVAKVQEDIIVVLCNGAPIEMSWLCKTKAVLEAYLGGQAAGGAITDILFGDANPCGKLAETFPVKLSHNPSYLNFPGEFDEVKYNEGLFVGYRYYDKKEIDVLFPFGYGLSYTKFEYSDIKVDKNKIFDNEEVEISIKVKNIGNIEGKEIVQLYVRDTMSNVIRPVKELKGFEKVNLLPGEEKLVKFNLGKRAFAYYNVDIKDWYVETGNYEILIGKSSKDIVLNEVIEVVSTDKIKKKFTRNSTIGDILQMKKGKDIINKWMSEFLIDNKVKSIDESKEVLEKVENLVLRSLSMFIGKTGEEAFSEDELLYELNEE